MSNDREEKQKRIIELRKETEDPNTPFNSCEDFSEIAKEVKTKTNLVNSLSEKLKGLQENNNPQNNNNIQQNNENK